ncbi:DUF397 domain-containing protein [Streptomyces sp. CA-288835]|uniref:DUF397 domain-containing protein n=1 Tax=Streptomyces sp. CA-288835 TaxID=3240069 RepID=UPI003D931759
MPVNWQKSSFSGAGGENCIELAHTAPHALLRESDTPADVLALPPKGLLALIRSLKGGPFMPERQ